MPPIRTENSKKLVEQEGRLELAISAYKNKQILSIREAACLYNVPYPTLVHRLNGCTARVNLRANSHKLTETEEESLIK